MPADFLPLDFLPRDLLGVDFFLLLLPRLLRARVPLDFFRADALFFAFLAGLFLAAFFGADFFFFAGLAPPPPPPPPPVVVGRGSAGIGIAGSEPGPVSDMPDSSSSSSS